MGLEVTSRTPKMAILWYSKSISRQQLLKHSYFIHFRFHDIGPLGRSQGGGARGQTLELPEIYFLFISK